MIKIGKDISRFSAYSCQPKTNEELKEIIKERIKQYGTECDLNDIDVSLIEDMSTVFFRSRFNGNISKWNVRNATDMSNMFIGSDFNGDISDWDVSNVKDMSGMFSMSKFNQDISDWKIKEDCDTNHMFISCRINKEFKPRQLQ